MGVIPNRFQAKDAVGVMNKVATWFESGDLEKALRATIPSVHESFEGNFMRAEGPNGSAWATRKNNKPHPILILSGMLIESVRDAGGAHNINIASARSLETGSSLFYAKYHQYGTKNEDGTEKMVARPFMYLNDEGINKAADKFSDACFMILVG